MTGRCPGAHRRRRDAGGRGGPGDALAAGQGRLGAQPPGAQAPERGCVMVTANVDIPALKARHPLGDTVEAAGVRLRGRGRVRQGVCPFHDEVEGSFTVYADSERFYCFGCGLGGDVLDFIQQAEGLSLLEAIARLDGSPGLAPRSATRPAPTRRTWDAALPPRDPALLTAAARFYAGRLRRSSEAREYLASRGVGPVAAARLGLGYAPGGGLRLGLESLGFSEQRIRDSGLFMERGAERFAGMVVVPDALRRSRPLARGPGRRPRPEAPVPGAARPQAGAGPRASRPRSASGRSLPKASSTGSPLPGGASHPAPLSEPRALSESPPPSGAAPASSSPSTATTAGLEATERLLTLLGTQGRRRHPSPGRRRRGRACGTSPRTRPPSSACSAQAARSAR